MRRNYGSRTGGTGYTGNTGWGTTDSYGSSWNTQEEPVHDYSWKKHIYEEDFRNLGGNIPEEEADLRQQGNDQQEAGPYDAGGGYADPYGAGGGYADPYGAGESYADPYGAEGYGSKRSRRRTGGADSYAGYPGAEESGYPEEEMVYGEPAAEEAGQMPAYPEEQTYPGGMQASVATFNRATLMKFISVFLILVYVMLLLIYTSGSTKPFQDVAGIVEASLDKESLLKQDTQALKRYYGLNSADYEGVLLYSAEFSISAEEVLMIETKNEQQVQEVQDAIDERLESRMHTFEGYAPEQVQLLEQAQVQVRGKFIFLAVSPDAENYASVFTKAL